MVQPDGQVASGQLNNQSSNSMSSQSNSPTDRNQSRRNSTRTSPRNQSFPDPNPDIQPYPISEDEDDHAIKQSNSTSIYQAINSPIDELKPSSAYVDSLLTDLYQLTMCYAYWRTGKQDEDSVFDLFFRDNPFGGEFTIFAGLEEVLRYVHSWSITERDVTELRRRYPDWEPAFWQYLKGMDTSNLKVYALEEGTVAVGRVPLIRVEGPLALCQMLETTMLLLVNYASLVTTNAARHRLAVGPHKTLLEFGMRRAQGPDGGISASRYSYIGGFDGTSNVKASLLFGIPCMGTHAHSFVSSFLTFADINNRVLKYNSDATATSSMAEHPRSASGEGDFVHAVQAWQSRLHRLNTNQSELAAFIAYALSFPRAFLALVDTYDVLESGLWNFLFVALALWEFGYRAKGLRLDSGDLAYQSRECRKTFKMISSKFGVEFDALTIVASNDLSETVLYALREQGHEIDTFAVGTHLVTCKAQPALGCVFKLVSINNQPRIKVSHDSAKITIPGKKDAYRLFSSTGEPVLDLLVASGTQAPQPQRRILCRHPFDANKRVYVTPAKVQALHSCFFDSGSLTQPFPSMNEIRHRVQQQLSSFREDHLRRLNPTPYKLSVTSDLYTFMHDLWLAETPITEIK